jgi:NADH:ubiquinone oxidoreductase subunit F (NADH-binding)/NAD-dependent dihydropyrimidine dehydrogenase PreA subunit
MTSTQLKALAAAATDHPAKDLGSDHPSIEKQCRIALANCGYIDPERIEDYFDAAGYFALDKVLEQYTPRQVIQIVLDSGLRGRGGAGFPTGRKWLFAHEAPGYKKFVVCNADEGDPGAFMDRSVLELDPHAVIEAMAIAAYAVGADEGYVYIRAEYPVAVKRLNKAIGQARDYGLLGHDILGRGFNFDLHIRLGAGAFVCGEETALLNSVEGKRGTPRLRPPFPAIKGLFEKPTVLNNVETYANVPAIIRRGSDWFSSIGTDGSKGTKVFALGGNVVSGGLIEVPMGTTLRQIIFEIGNGIPDGRAFKAAQTGGPSGGCIPAEHLDTPVDYESLVRIGSMMGSGGLIVMNEDKCMVGIAKFFMEFMVEESCGKCTPCRLGTRQLLRFLEKITRGQAEMSDIEAMESLAETMRSTSLCALGQTAANPVLSTLRYFRHEYEAHVRDKRCPSRDCKFMARFVINDNCKGCRKCASACPAEAISGTAKKKHIIDGKLCVKCGACLESCKFEAVDKEW